MRNDIDQSQRELELERDSERSKTSVIDQAYQEIDDFEKRLAERKSSMGQLQNPHANRTHNQARPAQNFMSIYEMRDPKVRMQTMGVRPPQ